MNEELSKLFNDGSWNQIALTFSVEETVDTLSFDDCLRLSYKLLYNEKWESMPQEYAVSLLYCLRGKYPMEWCASWRNEAFLGMACDITMRYDERYAAYKAALKMVSHPPAKLLIELARCHIAPGDPPVSCDEAIEFLKTAMQKQVYTDGAGLMCRMYWEKSDFEREAYWKNILKDLEENNGMEAPSLEPEFLIQN